MTNSIIFTLRQDEYWDISWPVSFVHPDKSGGCQNDWVTLHLMSHHSLHQAATTQVQLWWEVHHKGSADPRICLILILLGSCIYVVKHVFDIKISFYQGTTDLVEMEQRQPLTDPIWWNLHFTIIMIIPCLKCWSPVKSKLKADKTRRNNKITVCSITKNGTIFLATHQVT